MPVARHDFARPQDRQLVAPARRVHRHPCIPPAVNSPVERSSSATPTRPGAGAGERHQKRRLARLEIARVGERAGRDDAHDLAADEALGLLRVLDLLDDGDPKALAHQARDVAIGRVERHAAHRESRRRWSPSIAT